MSVDVKNTASKKQNRKQKGSFGSLVKITCLLVLRVETVVATNKKRKKREERKPKERELVKVASFLVLGVETVAFLDGVPDGRPLVVVWVGFQV